MAHAPHSETPENPAEPQTPHPVAFALGFWAHIVRLTNLHPLASRSHYDPLIVFARMLLLWWGVHPDDIDKAGDLVRDLDEALDEETFEKTLNAYYEAVLDWVKADKERAALWYIHSVALAVMHHQQFAALVGNELPAPVGRYLWHLRQQLPGAPLLSSLIMDEERDPESEIGLVLGLFAAKLSRGGG